MHGGVPHRALTAAVTIIGTAVTEGIEISPDISQKVSMQDTPGATMAIDSIRVGKRFRQDLGNAATEGAGGREGSARVRARTEPLTALACLTLGVEV